MSALPSQAVHIDFSDAPRKKANGTGSSLNITTDQADMQLGEGVDAMMLPQDRPLVNGGEGSSSTKVEEGWSCPVHIEVRLLPRSTLRSDTVRKATSKFIEENLTSLECESEVEGWRSVPVLADHVESMYVAESASGQDVVLLSSCQLEIHVYQPAAIDAVEEFSAGDPESGEGDDVMAATVAELPNKSMDGVWDSLIYADDIKVRLLNYIYTTLLFSDASVDFNIVSWNRVVLLHGPPGTGKTSLCRGLAQKLAIRLSDRYTHGKLVEINSHSLFSKWFSESGKLVQRLFSMVTEMVEDEQGFVVILIDEVESLAAARTGSMSGSEPSDALRVVNALLTQLDKLKHRKNVLVMTTSNISEAIDTAFVDRADIKQYIGLPPPQAVYWILKSCMDELMRARLVAPVDILDWRSVTMVRQNIGISAAASEKSKRASAKLWELAHQCTGMSGRTLRRLPVLAHARYIGLSSGGSRGGGTDPEVWLEAMAKALTDTQGEQAKVLQGSGV